MLSTGPIPSSLCPNIVAFYPKLGVLAEIERLDALNTTPNTAALLKRHFFDKIKNNSTFAVFPKKDNFLQFFQDFFFFKLVQSKKLWLFAWHSVYQDAIKINNPIILMIFEYRGDMEFF